MSEEKMLYDSTPAMFRNSPFLFLICDMATIIGIIGIIFWFKGEYLVWSVIAMICGIIGISYLLFWWLYVVNTRLRVTNERVSLRTGIFEKNIREVFLGDIRGVQINQRFMQRLLGTGQVEIASAASAEAEIRIDGIPSAYDVKNIIDEHRRKAKEEKND